MGGVGKFTEFSGYLSLNLTETTCIRSNLVILGVGSIGELSELTRN